MKQLAGKFALITGASQGLGRELALTYAREGIRGLALVARSKESLQKLQLEITRIAPNLNVAIISADLGSTKDVERVAAITLAACEGRLDILINNASTLGPVPMPYLLDYPAEDFQQALNVNLIAPFLLIQNLLPAMIDRGGSIINVTSDAGRVGYPGWGAYGISKFGLEGLSQTWAAELAKTDVRVNWVDPGNRIGQPVRYRYLSAPWPLSYYQNVYALVPGASEMASAGRAFTWKLLLQMRSQGVGSTSITLHTGLSSYLDNGSIGSISPRKKSTGSAKKQRIRYGFGPNEHEDYLRLFFPTNFSSR